MPSPKKEKFNLKPKSWNFEEEGIIVQVTLTDEGTFQIGSQYTPRFKTVETMEEAEEQVVHISKKLRTFIDLTQELDAWMDPVPENPPVILESPAPEEDVPAGTE